METVDVLIKNGHVIDPENDVNATCDVAIKNGKIYATGEKLQLEADSTFDASGCLVTPGLIDAHVHVYECSTPLGINPDTTCLARGVTTVIDAGSSGASTFPGLRKYIIEPCKTRVRCLLHIAVHGLAGVGCAGGAPGGESDTLAALNEDACQRCIEANRDVIVGVKVRLTASVCGKGKTEEAAFRRALSVSAKCKVPLMAHHTESSIPTQTSEDFQEKICCPAHLRPGDIYTHTYHGYPSSIVDARTRSVCDDVISAKSRGVYFDVGHGQGSFSWTVAEIGAKQGFWPDMLGTDLHIGNYDGPAYDLPTVMSKFVHLGMPLADVIRAVTITPAKAFGLAQTIGSLSLGKDADVTVLRVENCDVMMEDAQGQTRNMKKRLVPVAVWRAGMSYPITVPDPFPNLESQKKGLSEWHRLEIRDEEMPKC